MGRRHLMGVGYCGPWGASALRHDDEMGLGRAPEHRHGMHMRGQVEGWVGFEFSIPAEHGLNAKLHTMLYDQHQSQIASVNQGMREHTGRPLHCHVCADIAHG